MEYADIIQDSVDYVEEHLTAEITAGELARRAGFSLFHYYRIFQSVVGMPVLQYVQKRRLAHALYAISRGSRAVDAALAYGFDTHAGFYKAFQREYDCSPTQYAKRHAVQKPGRINVRQVRTMIQSNLKGLLKAWDLRGVVLSDKTFGENRVKSGNSCYVNGDLELRMAASPARMKAILQIAEALEAAGLSAARPVPTADGRAYVADGEHCFYLTKRQAGQLSSADLYRPRSEPLAHHIGEATGKLHRVLETLGDDVPCNDVDLYETVTDWAIPAARGMLKLPESFYVDYAARFGALHGACPRQVIHRDLNLSSFRFEGGLPVGFAAFELSERNTRLFDPCYAATSVLSENLETHGGDAWLPILHGILAGYDSVAELTQAEREAVPYVIFSIQLICVAYFGGQEKFAGLADTNRRMLEWLWGKREELGI